MQIYLRSYRLFLFVIILFYRHVSVDKKLSNINFNIYILLSENKQRNLLESDITFCSNPSLFQA